MTEQQVEQDKASGENMQWVYKPGDSKVIHMSEVDAAMKQGWKDAPVKEGDALKIGDSYKIEGVTDVIKVDTEVVATNKPTKNKVKK